MVQSEIYYMITINQHPDCTVTIKDLGLSLTEYAKKISKRWMLALEEGGMYGKLHYHLDLELDKPIRKDNIVRNIFTATKILKPTKPDERKYTVVANGTRAIPHKESWECHAIDYAAKDCQYTSNMDDAWIKEQVEKKKLKTLVEQRSIYIDRPKFWRLYREYLINRRRNMNMVSFQNLDAQEVFHGGMQEILEVYTPLWLKPDIIAHILNYQEGLTQYGECLEDAVNKHLLALSKPMEVEIVRRV